MRWARPTLTGRRFAAPVKLLLAAALVALLSWGLSRLHHPQWAESSPKAASAVRE